MVYFKVKIKMKKILILLTVILLFIIFSKFLLTTPIKKPNNFKNVIRKDSTNLKLGLVVNAFY